MPNAIVSPDARQRLVEVLFVNDERANRRLIDLTKVDCELPGDASMLKLIARKDK